mmetsp:Transcript_11602/g.17432  ORF Transcript_11602/g.17432 Transcript_11602/m.17432 type:complete len:321 (-) Transcript_11602:209-1171(-)
MASKLPSVKQSQSTTGKADKSVEKASTKKPNSSIVKTPSISPAANNEKNSPSKLEKLPSLNGNKGNNTKLKPKQGNDSASLADIPPLDGVVDSCTEIIPLDIAPTVVPPPDKPPILEETITAPVVTLDKVLAPAPIVTPAPIVNNNNGKVKLIYEQYDEEFPIQAGSTTQENIDEVYCLSFVMPNCRIHLSNHPPAVKRQMESDWMDAIAKGDDTSNAIAMSLLNSMYLEEIPLGVYQGLEDNKTYYVYVEQEADQLARDQQATRLRLQVEKTAPPLLKDDGRVMESCSCVYGNPCVDEYGCKDWNNRFAIATKNGWKGF